MKIPKAKCEKCKHCKLINCYGAIDCDFLNTKFTTKKPKRCTNFEKIGGDQNAR